MGMDRNRGQKECRRCASLSSYEQWRALPLLQSMSAGDLVPFVTTRWSRGAIEVRKCPQCGRGVARVVRPPAA
jgi:hypothetical protein